MPETKHNLSRIGNNVASGWGAYCENYEVLEQEKIVRFYCNEYGEKFYTDVTFDRLSEYDY